MSGVNLDELDDGRPEPDFRRANGAPMVKRPDGSGKWDRYSRPSSWGSDLDDESNLVNWRINRAIEGVAHTPSLAAKIAAHHGREDGWRELRDQAISIGRGEEAADMGTALHKMAERLEAEESFKAPPPYDADLAAYLVALDEAGLKSEYLECKVCSDRWRAAGTADRIYRLTRNLQVPDGPLLPAGSLVVGDLKTGKRLDYSLPGFAIQLAIYNDGCFYDVTTNERTPFPDGLRQDWAVLVHLPVGQARCELHWLDLSVGRVGAELVRGVRAWRKRSDFARDFIAPTSDEEAVMTTPLAATAALIEADPPAPWMAQMMEWAQQRINIIGNYSNEARALLLRKWPEGCPTLRQGGLSEHQMTRVLDLLDAVEAAFSIPFFPDPRVEQTVGLHKDQINRTNQPSNKETKES